MLHVYNRWTSTTVPHDIVIFFIWNIEKPIYCCISAKKNYYNLTKNKFQATVTERCTSPSNSSGIFRHKCFQSTCEKVKSLKRLYYAWTLLQEAFKVSWKIFHTNLQKPVCIIANIFCIRICICKKYFFALLLFLGWKAQ